MAVESNVVSYASVAADTRTAADSGDRIAWIKLSLCLLPLATPVSDAKVLSGRQKPLTEIAFVFAEIGSRDGFEGIGFGYSKRAGGPGLFAHARELAPNLLGEDPNDIARLFTKLLWAGASMGRSGLTTQAIAPFDIALWDLKARPVTPEDVEEYLEAYFTGLMKNVGLQRSVAEKEIKTAAAVHPMASLAGWGEGYGVEVRTWNAFSKGEPLLLHGEIGHRDCGERMQIFFAFSRARRDRPIWEGLRAVRKATSCEQSGSQE